MHGAWGAHAYETRDHTRHREMLSASTVGSSVVEACSNDAALQPPSLGAARADRRPAAVEAMNVTLEKAGATGARLN